MPPLSVEMALSLIVPLVGSPTPCGTATDSASTVNTLSGLVDEKTTLDPPVGFVGPLRVLVWSCKRSTF